MTYQSGFKDGYEHFRRQLLRALDIEIGAAGFLTRHHLVTARGRIVLMRPEERDDDASGS